MWDLSEHLGQGIGAAVTGHEQDFCFPVEGAFTDPQREYLTKKCLDPEKFFTIRQVHGAAVINADKALFQRERVIPDADGAVTNGTDVILSVRTADCLPIFLYDPIRRCIGLVHAGWKSTQQDITGSVLKVMYQNFQTYPSDIRVVLGPSIRSCCYQVGQEFCEVFPEQMMPREGDWFLDLQAANIQQLENFGVRRENIYDTELCTCCNDRFFSYRRDGDKAGRHLSLLMIKNEG